MAIENLLNIYFQDTRLRAGTSSWFQEGEIANLQFVTVSMAALGNEHVGNTDSLVARKDRDEVTVTMRVVPPNLSLALRILKIWV